MSERASRHINKSSRGPYGNDLRLIPEPLRSGVVEQCRAVCLSRQIGPPCVERNHACYRCQDMAANKDTTHGDR